MNDWSNTEIVVGVDFGTTHSGVSWASNSGNKSIRVITDWPNPLATNANADKVPSIISYDGDGQIKNWGYEVDVRETSCRWFKVLLENSPKYPQMSEVRQSHILLEKLRKTPEDVIADYLHALWVYAKEDIRKRVDDELWEFNTRVVLTVPAVWSDAAKDKTLKAAQRAGLGPAISLISEPEAAALATLLGKAERNTLMVGDAFVVCDAGGGTVDLIGYRILNTDPLEIEECAVGDGDLCGSVFLDTAFERYIKTIVGEDKYTAIKEVNRKKMLRGFEAGVKRAFTGDPKKEYTVDLKGVEDNEDVGICDDTITLKPLAIRTVFDHVCGQIEDLVQRQVNSITGKDLKVKAILLVGGFGESKYLHKRLETSYQSKGTRVMQVDGAWSSICRGATMWGLAHSARKPSSDFDDSDASTLGGFCYPRVRSRLARGSYGVAISVPFDEERHSWQDRYFDEAEGIWRASNQMRWLLKRGEEVAEGRVLDLEIYQNIAGLKWSSKGLKNFSQELFYCDRDQPPTRKDHTVRKVCQVNYAVSEPHLYGGTKAFKSKIDKIKYRHCGFNLQIILNNASLDFEVWFNNDLVGMVEASYMDT